MYSRLSNLSFLPSTVMPQPRLPQELTDYIIQYNQDDIETLKACATVSRSFLPISQKSIFSEITLSAPKISHPRLTLCQKLHQRLSSSPHLANYVRHLKVSEGIGISSGEGSSELISRLGFQWVHTDKTLGLVLEILKNVKSIRFDSPVPTAFPDAFLCSVKAGLRSPFLFRLQLNRVSVNFAIFESCVALKVLELRFVSFLGAEDEVALHPNKRCDLDFLTIFDSPSFLCSVNRLLGPGSPLGITHLRHLTVAADDEDAVTVIARLVEANACTLGEFKFTYRATVAVTVPVILPDPIDFRRCIHLCTVSFHVIDNKVFSCFPLRWVSQVLRSISTSIQVIKIVWTYDRSFDNFDVTGWNTIDSILTQSALPCLRQVNIKVYSTSNHSERFAMVRRALSGLDSAGILFWENRINS